MQGEWVQSLVRELGFPHAKQCSQKKEKVNGGEILPLVPRSILKFEMLLGTLDATPKFPNIPVSLQGNTEIPGVSREVPCSVLKCETVLDTLDATAKVPRHAGFPRGEHRGSQHHFI